MAGVPQQFQGLRRERIGRSGVNDVGKTANLANTFYSDYVAHFGRPSVKNDRNSRSLQNRLKIGYEKYRSLTRKGFGISQSHYIGLDVSARTVNLCVVDQDGRVAHERKLTSDPEEIAQHILRRVAQIGKKEHRQIK